MPGFALFAVPGISSFIAAWQSVKITAGGLLTGLRSFPDGTMTTQGDTFGGFMYVPTGTVTQDGTTWTAPAWKNLVTADSLPVGDATVANAYSLNTGAVTSVCAPSNTDVVYVWIFNKMFVSTNRGVTFTSLMTGFTSELTYNPNGGEPNNCWMAVDPGNPAVVYVVTPSSGTWVNTSGTSGGTWSKVTGISDGTIGGQVCFDQTSAFSGGRTQRLIVTVQAVTGHYESTDGGATFSSIITTGTPPTNARMMICDTFGQFWTIEAFRGATGCAFKWASSTWTKYTIDVSGNPQLTAILQDPTSVSAANNRMVAITWQGWLWATINGGTGWTSIDNSNITMSSGSPQAGWLNTINQYSFGTVQLNVVNAAMTPSGVIYAATGIDVWKTASPIVAGVIQSTANWTPDTLGIDQLVVNVICCPVGYCPVIASWDRALILSRNPDSLAAAGDQYADKNSTGGYSIITSGWSVDYAKNRSRTLVANATGSSTSNVVVSQNGGNTWAAAPANPSVGIGAGGCIAASTDQKWATIPGDTTGQNTVVYFTTNGGTSWTLSVFTGTPTSFISLNAGHFNNRQPLCADSTTSGTYYIIDQNRKVFKSTDDGANFAATGATAAQFNSFVQQDRLLCPPPVGSASTAGHVFYAPQNGNIFKSIDAAANFTKLNTNMDAVTAFGFGAPSPSSASGYPTIYAIQGTGTTAQGLYQSVDGGPTWTACSLPTSEKTFPYRILDYPQWVSGDPDVYGRIYVGFKGNTATYIDTSDALPWVSFTSINPNASVTGTITLTAQHSGRVTVAAVKFFVDGVQIGATQTGQSTYSVSWNTGLVATGAHTLTVSATGANGTASKSIQITTT